METTKTLRTLRNELAAAQKQYATARALYDTAAAASSREIAALTVERGLEPGSDAFFDECDALEDKLQTGELFRLRLQAEVVMVEAVRAIMTADPRVAARYSTIAPAFEQWRTAPLKLRDRMVDLCFRFAA